MDEFNAIPKKQSNWVHIPIGRILTELTKVDCKLLKDVIDKTREVDNFFPLQKIKVIKISLSSVST